MIKDNQKYFNRLHVVLDALVIAVSYWLSWVVRFSGIFFKNSVRTLSFGQYMQALVIIIPGYLVLYSAFNLYTPKRVQGRQLELANIVKANTLGVLLMIVALYMLKEPHYSRTMLGFFYVINIVLEECLRMTVRLLLRRIRKKD